MLWGKQWGTPLSKKETVSVEGFFDTLKKILKINPDVKRDGNRIRLDEDMKHIITEYFSDREWVEKNLKTDKIIVLGKWEMWNLSVRGKAPRNPEDSLQYLRHNAQEALSKNTPAYLVFAKQWSDALDAVIKFHKSQVKKDPDEVEKYALDLIKKIELPKPVFTVPQYKLPDTGIKLPVLSVDDIVKTSAKMIEMNDWVEQQFKQHKYIGIDWGQADFFDDIGNYDGENIRTGLVGDFFYEQAVPEEVQMPVIDATYDLKYGITAMIDWFCQATGLIAAQEIRK